MMKKNFSSGIIFLFAIIFSSCVENPESPDPLPQKRSLTPLSFIGQELQAYDSAITEGQPEIDALLSLNEENSLLDDRYFNSAQALFLDDSIPVPVFITLNSQYLSDFSDKTYFDYDIDIADREKNNLYWSVRSYLGQNINRIFTSSKRISISDINAFDTISLSNTVLSYSGAEDGKIFVQMQISQLSPVTSTDSIGERTTYLAKFTDNDDGNISLLNDRTKDLLPNKFYSVGLLHYRYEQDTLLNGKIVGYIASYSTEIPLFIKK